MEIKVTEIDLDGKVESTRVFHDVTELKEIETHSGSVEPLHEYINYWYEVWSGETKLGGFNKDYSQVSIKLNKTEQLQ